MRRHAKAPSAAPRASRQRRFALLTWVTAVLLMFLASTAFAAQTRNQVATIDPSAVNNGGVPNGAFGALSGLAVDQSGGDLYATDFTGAADSSGAVHRFGDAGAYEATVDGSATPQGSFAFEDPSDVAVDNSATASDGTIYVADIVHNFINAFDSSGAPKASFSGDGQLDGSATDAGAFNLPCGVAVDDEGNLYVGDFFNAQVWIFNSSGAYLGKLPPETLSTPCGMAFDSTGALYVRNYFAGNVVKFDRIGPAAYEAKGEFATNGATDVAVDLSSDHVLVNRGSRVDEFDSAGNLIATFGDYSNSTGVAVDAASGRVYVADGSTLRVYGPIVTLPDVATGTASNLGDTTATVAGTLNPSGVPLTDCRFEYVATELGTQNPFFPPFDHSAPCDAIDGDPISGPGEVPVDVADHAVSASLTGLDPDTAYAFRLSASSAGGTTVASNGDRGISRFRTTASSTSTVLPASPVTETSAVVGGSVDPNGLPTIYYIEYSENADFSASTSVPAGQNDSAGSGSDPVIVSRLLSDLQPDTEYHFRLVSQNSSGSSTSETVDFRTLPSVPVAPVCPNERFRTGPSAGLPDCRAFEKLTPSFKNGGDALPGAIFDADHVNVSSLTSFLTDDTYFRGDTRYLGARSPDDWTLRTGWIAPKTKVADLNSARTIEVIEQDCGGGGQFNRCPSLLPEDTDLARDVYVRSGAGVKMVSTGSITANADVDASYGGMSDDGAHIVFQTVEELEPSANSTADGVNQTYELFSGATRVVGILPGARCAELSLPSGCVHPGGAVLGDGVHEANNSAPAGSQGAISADGSKIFFESPDPGRDFLGLPTANAQLYVRIDGSETVEVSASQCNPACSGPTRPARFQGASRDGSRVYFSTAARLLNADADDAYDLYQYRVDTAQLTLVSTDCLASSGNSVDCGWPEELDATSSSHGMGVTGVSANGKRVYFGAPPAPAGDFGPSPLFSSLWLYDEQSGTTKFVAPNGDGEGSLTSIRLTRPAVGARMTPDGGVLVFQSALRITSFDNTDGCVSDQGFSGPCTEIYRFSVDTGAVDCLSCNPTGALPDGHSRIDTLQGAVVTSLSPLASGRNPNQVISDDGEIIVFPSSDALVPRDTNGKTDIYTWSRGRLSLITSGTGSFDSELGGISADGRGIFFTTPDRLVPADMDVANDLYGARINGGLAVDHPGKRTCNGDACRDSASPSPSDVLPASASFHADGNTKPKKIRCVKGKVKRKGRCVGKRHRNTRSKAKQNGGMGR